MKKVYSKPEIMFEDFALSTNIAGTCELDTTLPNYEQSCGYLDPRDPTQTPVFVEGAVGCARTQPESLDSVCYHNPSDLNNLFNS